MFDRSSRMRAWTFWRTEWDTSLGGRSASICMSDMPIRQITGCSTRPLRDSVIARAVLKSRHGWATRGAPCR
eukprot:2747567-Alexandrium_andersonii.AAC.1